MAPSISDVAYYAVRLSIFIVSNIYCLVAYMFWMTLLTPLRIWAPRVYWRIEQQLFYWLETVCASWITFGGYQVIECGDDISSLNKKNCLLLPNHQSTADVPIVMLALHGKKTVVSKLMWVIFSLYKWTNFGLVCQHREDFFIDVGKSARDNQMIRFKRHLEKSYFNLSKKWIVIFPEGGFLCRNQEANERYAKKNNLPQLKHVLLPRVGAVKAVLDVLGEPHDGLKSEKTATSSFSDSSIDRRHVSNPVTVQRSVPNTQLTYTHSDTDEDQSGQIKYVIDMTIAYKNKQPLELLGMSIGYDPHNDILVHWRTYRVKDIPRDEEVLTAWLYERYIEKEQMLDDYYKFNKMPEPSTASLCPPLKPRYFKFDFLYQIIVHVALFTLFYLQYVLFMTPVFSLISFLFSFIFSVL